MNASGLYCIKIAQRDPERFGVVINRKRLCSATVSSSLVCLLLSVFDLLTPDSCLLSPDPSIYSPDPKKC
jgi:hypothetical protein